MKPAPAFFLPLLVVSVAFAQPPSDDAESFFESKIRPVLAAHCFKCHGGEKVSSGLRVDSREALVQGGEHGPAIVPGDAEQSLLVQAIRHGEERKMPPEEPLPAADIAALEAWIKQGARWPARLAGGQSFRAARHWAFEPPAPVSLPDDATGWAETPIDRFVAARLREHHLRPQPPTDRATLLRRVTFDIVGLPPTPPEIEAFANDAAPDAYERVVERLLASSAYGERWSRHWMDVVRYADTAGDNADYPIPEARLYRDYIVSAFNNDKPFDQFLREQLAGDILAKQQPWQTAANAERIAATGFLALSRRYGTAPYELWHLTLEDTIDTTGRAILGLSLRCARCHDHKFDPVTSQDYYALYGIFASTQFPWAGGEELQSKNFDRQHFVSLASPAETAAKLERKQAQITQLEEEIKRLKSDDPEAKRVAELEGQIKNQAGASAAAGVAVSPGATAEVARLTKERDETHRRLQTRLNKLERRLRLLGKAGLPAELPGAYAVHDGPAADVRLQRHGDPADLGNVVARDVPQFLSRGVSLQIPVGASGRLELAEWLTRPDHPLTARVIVNRVWQHHFGKGIVATPSNFGLRGDLPTHPELLDWLTGQFVANGWSIKNLHRLIVRSKTYRLASGTDEENLARDPSNRWYWRFDRRRLEAEAIRDAMLVAGGHLDLREPPDHPFPPIADWNWTQHSPFKAVYPSNHRSVYLMTQRIQRHPYLALFDGPDPNVSTDQRTSATVPLQALYMMNNSFVGEQAAAFADRILGEACDARRRVRMAFLVAYGREPQGSECDRGIDYVDKYAAECAAAGVSAAERERAAWASYARVLLTGNEFVYVD